MHQYGADEVILSDHGGSNPRRLPVMDVSASWEISHPGAFSCFARIDDLRAAGLGWDLQDMWIEWHHPILGTWGGVCAGRPVENGLAEIEGEGWAVLLRDHMLPEVERLPEGGLGGLARRAVIDAGAASPTFLTIGTIDEGGESASIVLGGQDALDDVLSGMAEDLEWRVEPETRVFHAMRKLGRDRSAEIRLVEDVHVIDVRLAEDTWTAPPDEVFDFESLEESARRRTRDTWGTMRELDPTLSLVAAIPEPVRVSANASSGGGGRRNRRRRRGRDRDHRRRRRSFSRRRHHGRGGGATHANFPAAIPHWALHPPGYGLNHPAVSGNSDLRLPTTPADMQLINVDDVWRSLALGNTYRLDVGSVGFTGLFRVWSYAVSVSEHTLLIAGEAIEDDG